MRGHPLPGACRWRSSCREKSEGMGVRAYIPDYRAGRHRSSVTNVWRSSSVLGEIRAYLGRP